MRKSYCFIILTLIALLFAGCSGEVNGGSRRIVAPVTDSVPIEGKWEISKELGTHNANSSERNEWIGKRLEFSKEKIMIGDYTLRNAGFKTRSVNADEYFLFNHKSFGSDLYIPPNPTNVITITEKDKFYCEIIEIDENTLVLEINNYNLLVNKAIESKMKLAGGESLQRNITSSLASDSMDNNIKSGVLLGIRTPMTSADASEPSYRYRTIWIAADNHKLHKIVEKQNIIFPRKSGFWQIKVTRQIEDGVYKDNIEKYNITINQNTQMMLTMMAKNVATKNTVEENVINYLGNDYISIERKGQVTDTSDYKLMIVPIDSLPNLIPVKLSELINGQSSVLADSNTNILLEELKRKNYSIVEQDQELENIGLVRNAGHWYFKGRVDYLKDGKLAWTDYRINLIPPQNLIFYDELYVKWTDIKSVIPDATDAFTSPEKDLALIVSKKNKLLVYAIKNQSLGKTPLKTISLKEGETIVMAEWATGSYVDNWEKTFESIK